MTWHLFFCVSKGCLPDKVSERGGGLEKDNLIKRSIETDCGLSYCNIKVQRCVPFSYNFISITSFL